MLSVTVTMESKRVCCEIFIQVDVQTLCCCTMFQYKSLRIGAGGRGDNNDDTLHHNLENQSQIFSGIGCI